MKNPKKYEKKNIVKSSFINFLGSKDADPVFWKPKNLDSESAWWSHVPFAFWLTSVLKPKTFVELGTHNGVSYFSFCEAIERLNLDSAAYAVDTWDGDEQAGYYDKIAIYEKVFNYNQEYYSDFSALLRMKFDEAVEHFPDGSIDLLHIDGLHTYEAVKHDFETWKKKLAENSVVLFHDTNVRAEGYGVWKYFQELKHKYNYFEFEHGYGLCIIIIGDKLPNELLELCNLTSHNQISRIRKRFSSIGLKWALASRQISDLRTELHRREVIISEKNFQFDKLQQEYQNLGSFVLQKDVELHDLQNTLSEKTVSFDELNNELHRVNSVVLQKDAELYDLQNKLSEKIDCFDQLDGEYRLLSSVVLEKDAELDELKNRLFEVINDLGSLTIKLDSMSQQNDEAKIKIESMASEKREILNSTSWKFTAPMRAVSGKLKKMYRLLPITKKLFFNVKNEIILRGGVITIFEALNIKYCNEGIGGVIKSLNKRVNVARESNQPSLLLSHAHPDKFNENFQQKKLNNPYDDWICKNILTKKDVLELKAELLRRESILPKISLLIPMYNSNRTLLEELLGCLYSQIYENWEACFVDDGSIIKDSIEYIIGETQNDNRILFKRLHINGGISLATNEAALLASGDVIAFLDHDDLITADCLAEIALYYADNPESDIVYSDDDKIDMMGKRYDPQFKPDWSPILLLSYMYFGHIFTVRRDLFSKLGGFRKEFDGSQDYDFALRATEKARHIGHIPKILYHWRAAPGSVAVSTDEKPRSIEVGRLAVEEALIRRDVKFNEVIHPSWAYKAGIFEIQFPDNGPSVAIIIPTKNQKVYLKQCIDSLNLTTYKNYSIYIIDNESDDIETLIYLNEIQDLGLAIVKKIPNINGVFNFSRINNQLVSSLNEELVLFLNNDTKVINPNWLSLLVGYISFENIGAVGAKTIFEDGSIQQSGVIHSSVTNLPGCAFRGHQLFEWGYLNLLKCSHEVSSVSAAAMLTRREIFTDIGGFDEINFAVAYNDVDYCYRLISLGKKVIISCGSELFHYEGKTRGYIDNPAERVNFRRKYFSFADRYYNRNLNNNIDTHSYVIDVVRPASVKKGAIRVVFVSHNLNHEGAPTTLFDLVIGLRDAGYVDPIILSPEDGPLKLEYEKSHVEVKIINDLLQNIYNPYLFDTALKEIGQLFQELGAEVVVANTLVAFWAINSSYNIHIPALWSQHESEPWDTYFNYLPEFLRPIAYTAFTQAFKVLYVAESTMMGWSTLNQHHNFKLIRHGIPQGRLNAEVGKWSREAARHHLDLDDNTIVIELTGTLCERKNQIELIKAFNLMEFETSQKIKIFIVGKSGQEQYLSQLNHEINSLPVDKRDKIIVTGSVEDPFLYYKAADIAVCCSIIESAPRVIVEAMACSLPIISTSVFGIPEIVAENVNAIFYKLGDATDLCKKLVLLINNNELRHRLSTNSRSVLEGQPGFDEMVNEYGCLIRQIRNLNGAKLNN